MTTPDATPGTASHATPTLADREAERARVLAEITAMIDGTLPRNQPLLTEILASPESQQTGSLMARLTERRRFSYTARGGTGQSHIPGPSAWLPPSA